MMPKIDKPKPPPQFHDAADAKAITPFDPAASAYKQLTATGPGGLQRKANTIKPTLLGE